MANDHSYGIDSTQQEDVIFNSEWSQILSSDYGLFDEETLAHWNCLDNFEQGDQRSSQDREEVIEVDEKTDCKELINYIFPKKEVIEYSPDTTQCVESSNASCMPSSLPASQNWPGEYNFNVSFSPQEKKTKGVSWTYSDSKNKLYVGKDIPCPVNFSTDSIMPDDVRIRTMALYSSPESASEVVERCANHSREDKAKNILEADHFVRCESTMANYEVDSVTKRHSVIVPFENPPAGQVFSTYIYKFACFGSCPGPNRRPLMVVFSLEQGNQVIGRKKIDVKICACPGRDSKADEQQSVPFETGNCSKKRKKRQSGSLYETMGFSDSSSKPSTKKAKVMPNQDGFFQLNVKDYGCFEFLEQMKKLYEIFKTMKNMPPDVKRVLAQYHQRKGYNLEM